MFISLYFYMSLHTVEKKKENKKGQNIIGNIGNNKLEQQRQSTVQKEARAE